jgi:ADP-heptose:LPS heptosyltransferase
MTRRSVFVFLPYCPGSIGEQVVQLPFFRVLREREPEAWIVGVAPTASGAVIAALGLVDELVTVPVRGGALEAWRILRDLRRRDASLVYQLRRKSLRAALFARGATNAPIDGFAHGVNRWIQRRSVPFDTSIYLAEDYMRLLDGTVAEFAGRTVPAREGPVLVIPGGLTPIKRWPMDSYLRVAGELSTVRSVRFLLGPDMVAERDTLQADSRFEAIVGPTMPEIERLTLASSLVIANDCGPAHFAHVYDVPRISIFDRSIVASHWFSAGKHGRLLQSPAPGRIDEVRVEDVLAIAQGEFGV